jgi:UPF0716 family protein affecting phage T7 exclusion
VEADRLTSGALLGRVLRRTAAVLRSDSRYLFALAVIVFVPVGVLEGLVDMLAEHDLGVALIVSVASVATIALIGDVFYSGAVAGLIARRPGEQRSLRRVARELRYGRLIAADILVTLAVALGLLLLIVPGIVFFALFAFVAPVIEIEDRTVRDAFRRSRELVRGRFWLVLVAIGGAEIASELGISGLASLAHLLLGEHLLVDWLSSTLGDVLTTPPYAAFVVLMAVELMRERGEA